jgi:flagellar FliL protein
VAKNEVQAAARADDDAKEGEAAAEGETPKQSFVKRILNVKNLLGNKKLLIIAGAGGLILLLAIGGGAYFLFFSGSDAKKMQMAAGEPLPLTPPNITFYDVPDIIVNIQGADSAPAYLKLSVSLELDSAEEKAGMVALQPRIVDQFQGYLRELRLDDLKGSAGVVRLKEELLRRINVAAAPYRVRDVLLKQMIVQ